MDHCSSKIFVLREIYLNVSVFTVKADAKWEFPRKDIILDKTIGEGEFGKVVRAQAINIDGKNHITTVAVKMLKGMNLLNTICTTGTFLVQNYMKSGSAS